MPGGLPSASGWAMLVLLVALAAPFWFRRARLVGRGQGICGTGNAGDYGPPDLVFLLVLTGCLAVPILASQGVPTRPLHRGDIVVGILIYGMLLAGVLAAVVLRGRSVPRLFRLGALSAPRVLGRSALHLLAAYPAVFLAMLLMATLLPGGPPQEVVRFILGSTDWIDRWIVIAAAVCFAPIAEEIIFRGYFHGVLRRYIGPLPSALATSALFASVHLNALHFPALLLLGLALTLAYETEGSLAVPITMHALFNGASTALLLLSPVTVVP